MRKAGSTCAPCPNLRQGLGVLFYGFLSRLKLSGSGLKKLRLLLGLEITGSLVGPARVLGHVHASLGGP